MRDSTSVAVHPHPLFDLDVGLFSPVPPLAHRFQSAHPSGNCFYETGPQLTLSNPSYSRADTGTVSVQSLTGQWRTSAISQCPFFEPPVQNQVSFSYRNEACEDSLVTEHRPASMAQTIPQSKVLTLHDQPVILPLASPVSQGRLEESTSEFLPQANKLSPSQECYTLWKKIPGDALVITGSNKFVPQTLYRPFTEADKERYLERVSLSTPIIFITKESLEWGISLEDVRNGKTQQLVDKDVPVLQDCGPSVSVRINWPGYPSFKRQISSRNWRRLKGPITKEKLAQNLAKTTDRFIEKMSNKALEVGVERSWKVGPQYIKVDDLILVSLHHVSKGSWQPQFRLRRDVA